MRPRNTVALLAIAATVAITPAARAQASDSVRRWSIFGGSDEHARTYDGLLSNYEFGGSGDFRLGTFPLPLRATVSFSKLGQGGYGSDQRFGSLSLDAIAHPIPKIFGIHPYLLGGLGVATRAPFTGIVPGYYDTSVPVPNQGSLFRAQRQNWAFAEVGGGLEVGRLFVQWKTTTPVASEGISRTPLNFGFRF